MTQTRADAKRIVEKLGGVGLKAGLVHQDHVEEIINPDGFTERRTLSTAAPPLRDTKPKSKHKHKSKSKNKHKTRATTTSTNRGGSGSSRGEEEPPGL